VGYRSKWGWQRLLLAGATIFLLAGCDAHLFNSSSKNTSIQSLHNVTRDSDSDIVLREGERLITVLATNDIHGGVEPKVQEDGKKIGGMALFSSVVQSIRNQIKRDYEKTGDVLLVDAGDQYQGTLISNYTEGDLVYSLMNEIGYDAVVPGNHAYDFGPAGWFVDKAPADDPTANPREVIEKLARKAKFPMLSANTYLKKSLVDKNGNGVSVDGAGCQSTEIPRSLIQWDLAERPSFLKPYIIKNVAGVRVALIGMDHPQTPIVTVAENVSDLCFRDEVETYLEVRNSLEGIADVFVLILHNGNSGTEFPLTNLIKKLTRLQDHSVDAVIAGHTHFINFVHENGVLGIQSGSDGERFGRIDLVWDSAAQKVIKSKARGFAGIQLSYEGHEKDGIRPDSKIEEMITAARKAIQPLAERKLGIADQEIQGDRIDESPLANLLTDAFRSSASTDLALINTGGIRAALPKGVVTYEDLFQVLPFNNHGLVIGPMKWSQIKNLLQRSIESCGNYGALMQSGLRVTFSRDCYSNSKGLGGKGKRVGLTEAAPQGVDRKAKLLHVETVSHEVLLDVERGIEADSEKVFRVATLDFLVSGGSGYGGFKGTSVLKDIGVLREILTEELMIHPGHWTGSTDSRWKAANQGS